MEPIYLDLVIAALRLLWNKELLTRSKRRDGRGKAFMEESK